MKTSVLNRPEAEPTSKDERIVAPSVPARAKQNLGATEIERHEVVGSFDDLAAVAKEWDALALSLSSDIYSTYDWCRIWWRYYGSDRQLMVHLFRRGGTLCAVVPMFVESLGIGPARIKIARLIGCDHTVTTCGVLCGAGDISWVIRQVAEQCRSADCDVTQLGPLAGDDEAAMSLTDALSRTEFSVVRRLNRHPHMLFDVPSSSEAFMEGLSTKERRNLRRDQRKLAERGALASELITDKAELALRMDHFIRTHQEQWRAQGQLGHFDDWPQSRAFHHELAACQNEKGRLLLSNITVDGATVAMEYSYHFGQRVHWILGARTADVSGRIGFAALMEDAIMRNAKKIDALRGYYDYKRLLGATCVQQCVIVAARPGWLRRARLAGFASASQVLDRLYYRLWFSRLRPLLGLPGRPLRKNWIRSRL